MDLPDFHNCAFSNSSRLAAAKLSCAAWPGRCPATNDVAQLMLDVALLMAKNETSRKSQSKDGLVPKNSQSTQKPHRRLTNYQ